MIDDYLDRKASLNEYFLFRSPLAIVAAGFITGIIAQYNFDTPPLLWFFILCICSTAVLFRKSVRQQTRFISACAFIAFVSLGAIRLNTHTTPEPNDIRNLVTQQRTLAKIRGTVRTNPAIENRSEWLFAKYLWTEPSTSFYMKLSEVHTTDGWQDATGFLRVQISETMENIAPGDVIEIHCWLNRFAPPNNPGQFDIEKYLKRRNVYLAASVKSKHSIEILSKAPINSFTAVKNKLKTIATVALIGKDVPQDKTNPLLAALILGQRNYNTATYQAFQKTGLAHFICLSGMHMGILAGFAWACCKPMGFTKRTRAAICACIIILYVIVVPPRAPTLRAGIICLSFCLSVMIRQKLNPLNSLSLSAIILLFARPLDILSPGLQLSYATVLGIIMLYPHINNFFAEFTVDKTNLHKDYIEYVRNAKFYLSRLLSACVDLFCVGAAAWLGGAGILLYHFGTITPLSALWTIIVFPIVLLILVFGFIKIILAAIFPTLSVLLAIIVSGLCDLLDAAVRAIASFDTTPVVIGKTSACIAIFFYLILIFLKFVNLKPITKKRLASLMIVILVSSLIFTKHSKTPAGQLSMTLLNVGHGQAAVLTLPNGKTILCDAGSISTKNAGQKVVLPFLFHQGIGKLDAILISHDDIDHINAIPEIAARFGKTKVYANNAFLEQTKGWSTAAFLAKHLKTTDITILPITSAADLSDTAKITPLWPGKAVCDNQSITDNDKSQVILIEYADRKILLCGDIEEYAQSSILKDNPELNVDVIVMPHHGSNRDFDKNFVTNLNPQAIVISCSAARCESAFKPNNNIKAFYTPEDGAVTIKIKANGKITTTGFENLN